MILDGERRPAGYEVRGAGSRCDARASRRRLTPGRGGAQILTNTGGVRKKYRSRKNSTPHLRRVRAAHTRRRRAQRARARPPRLTQPRAAQAAEQVPRPSRAVARLRAPRKAGGRGRVQRGEDRHQPAGPPQRVAVEHEDGVTALMRAGTAVKPAGEEASIFQPHLPVPRAQKRNCVSDARSSAPAPSPRARQALRTRRNRLCTASRCAQLADVHS